MWARWLARAQNSPQSIAKLGEMSSSIAAVRQDAWGCSDTGRRRKSIVAVADSPALVQCVTPYYGNWCAERSAPT